MSRILRLTHISDTHGNFPELGANKVIVHSGDMLPNEPLTFGPPVFEIEKEFQELWLRKKARKVMGWLRDRTFLFCAGNHDYYDPVPLLRRMGIDAHNITHAIVKVEGFSFYGFPYVPMECHPWNYAEPGARLAQRLDDISHWWDAERVDVLVTHCPPSNVFDECPRQKKRFGMPQLNDFLNYKISRAPLALLCGHIHGDNGVTMEFDTMVSQAATKVHQLEIRD